MWSIVARRVNFGMTVAYMISVEQRAIETLWYIALRDHELYLNITIRCLVDTNMAEILAVLSGNE